jgi:hypothetical protein
MLERTPLPCLRVRHLLLPGLLLLILLLLALAFLLVADGWNFTV